MGRNSSRKQLRRSGRGGRLDGNSGEESVRFEAKKPEQDSGFDDLSETKYGKKQEKLSQLGLKAIEIQEIEDQLDGELDAMLDVREPTCACPTLHSCAARLTCAASANRTALLS